MKNSSLWQEFVTWTASITFLASVHEKASKLCSELTMKVNLTLVEVLTALNKLYLLLLFQPKKSL